MSVLSIEPKIVAWQDEVKHLHRVAYQKSGIVLLCHLSEDSAREMVRPDPVRQRSFILFLLLCGDVVVDRLMALGYPPNCRKRNHLS